jgi:hypothetical protein
MNKGYVILAAIALLLLVSSCDFFRGLAGRPGSAEIQRKRALIEQVEAQNAARRDSLEKARLDSIARQERYVADSLYAVDTLTRCGKLRKLSALSGIPRSAVHKRCCIVVGAFANPKNAEKLSGRYRDAGYESYVVVYRNGLNAVFVAPSDKITGCFESYRGIVRLPFASKESWILVKE